MSDQQRIPADLARSYVQRLQGVAQDVEDPVVDPDVEILAATVAARVEARVAEMLVRYQAAGASVRAANEDDWIPEQSALTLLEGRYSQRTLRRMRQAGKLPHRLAKRGERDRVLYHVDTVERLRRGEL
jgi:hypothetical protein